MTVFHFNVKDPLWKYKESLINVLTETKERNRQIHVYSVLEFKDPHGEFEPFELTKVISIWVGIHGTVQQLLVTEVTDFDFMNKKFTSTEGQCRTKTK